MAMADYIMTVGYRKNARKRKRKKEIKRKRKKERRRKRVTYLNHLYMARSHARCLETKSNTLYTVQHWP